MFAELSTVLDDIAFPESPRWRSESLWFSDQRALEVRRTTGAGHSEVIVEVPEQPSGLGWARDGDLLVVSMLDRRLLRFDGSRLHAVADLSGHVEGACNDMIVDTSGRAYIGNFGERRTHEPPRPTRLVSVAADGTAAPTGEGVAVFPNGMVLTRDESTLIVAETYGQRLSAWHRSHNGALSEKREWAQLDGHTPDGLCLDAEGAVWCADPQTMTVMRVREGGKVLSAISTAPRRPYACVLGGRDLRQLFVCTSAHTGPEAALARTGRIESVTVDVPGANLP